MAKNELYRRVIDSIRSEVVKYEPDWAEIIRLAQEAQRG